MRYSDLIQFEPSESVIQLLDANRDHLRGSSDNVILYTHLADGAARVRFRLLSEGWRWAERDLYRVFCETFGTPPLCNRMSP